MTSVVLGTGIFLAVACQSILGKRSVLGRPTKGSASCALIWTVSSESTLVSAGISPFGIALDLTTHQMYWSNTLALNDIRRANLSSTSQQTIVTGNDPTGIAIDSAAGKIYWVNQFGNTLWRANLDGTDPEQLPGGLTEPTALALDLAKGKIYVTTFHGLVQRVDSDGTRLETPETGQSGAEAIALNTVDGTMFWTTDSLGKSIQRANLDGSDEETIVSGLIEPVGIALQIDAASVPEGNRRLLVAMSGAALVALRRKLLPWT